MNIEPVMSLDLEMNQPSGKIIQVGVCVGNPLTGEVLERAKWYVKIDEPLNPMIVDLTGITEKHLAEQGIELADAYRLVFEMHRRHGCFINAVTWGGGDTVVMREQMGISGDDPFVFGRRWIDTKTLFQEWRRSRGERVQGGLAKSMLKLDLAFQGRKHDAGDDAFNTFRMYVALLKKFRA